MTIVLAAILGLPEDENGGLQEAIEPASLWHDERRPTRTISPISVENYVAQFIKCVNTEISPRAGSRDALEQHLVQAFVASPVS